MSFPEKDCAHDVFAAKTALYQSRLLQVDAASGNRTHDLVARRKHEDHRDIAAQTSESHAMDADSGGIHSNTALNFAMPKREYAPDCALIMSCSVAT